MPTVKHDGTFFIQPLQREMAVVNFFNRTKLLIKLLYKTVDIKKLVIGDFATILLK